MAVNDVYRVSMDWSASGTPDTITTSFHYAQRGANVLSITTVGQTHRDFWLDIRSRYSGSIFMFRVRLRRVDPLEPLEQSFIVPVAEQAGTSATDQIALNACVLVNQRTGLVGRSFRGRNYLPPFADAWNDTAGLWDLGAVTDVQDAVDTLKTTMGGLPMSYDPVVYSELLGTAENITSSRVDRIPRSQRRRQPSAGTYVS